MDKNVQTKTLLASMFATQMMLDPYGEFRDLDDLIDRSIEYNEASENVKFYMNLKLIKLINEGYTDDEILEMIDMLDVEGLKELPQNKQNYVREETKKLIMKRKERFEYE